MFDDASVSSLNEGTPFFSSACFNILCIDGESSILYVPFIVQVPSLVQMQAMPAAGDGAAAEIQSAGAGGVEAADSFGDDGLRHRLQAREEAVAQS